MITESRRASPHRPAPTREVGGGSRLRTCVGCGAKVQLGSSAPADQLVHFVVDPQGRVAVDAAGRGGRGAHVHAASRCLEQAVLRGLQRSFRRALTTDYGPWGRESVARMIVEAYDRRIEGLLVSAKRCRALAVGGDAVTREIDGGGAALVLVARDAAAAAELGAVRRAIAAGRAVAWGEKSTLARLLRAGVGDGGDAPPVAVVAVTDDRLATAIGASVLAREAATSACEGEARQAEGRRRPSSWERGA